MPMLCKVLLLLKKLVANLQPRDAVWNLGVIGNQEQNETTGGWQFLEFVYACVTFREVRVKPLRYHQPSTPAKSCANQTHPTRLLSNMHDLKLAKNMWKARARTYKSTDKRIEQISHHKHHVYSCFLKRISSISSWIMVNDQGVDFKNSLYQNSFNVSP